jgi:two-component system NtrC family sensor kinase
MGMRERAVSGPQILRKRRAARKATAIHLKEEIANLRLELLEVRQQQVATADVLKVISRSTFDLQTLLQALVESAARLCDAEGRHYSPNRGRVFSR